MHSAFTFEAKLSTPKGSLDKYTFIPKHNTCVSCSDSYLGPCSLLSKSAILSSWINSSFKWKLKYLMEIQNAFLSLIFLMVHKLSPSKDRNSFKTILNGFLFPLCFSNYNTRKPHYDTVLLHFFANVQLWFPNQVAVLGKPRCFLVQWIFYLRQVSCINLV